MKSRGALVMTALFALAMAAAGCSAAARVAGRYVHRDEPREVLELRRDGSFTLEVQSGRLSGRFTTDGERITLEPAGAPAIVLTRGEFVVVFPDGHRWARKWPAGHYAHARRPEVFVDLRPDRTYRFAKGVNDHKGRYDVDGGTLTLWYPSDGRCTKGGSGPAVPSPGQCAFFAAVRGDSFTFFELTGEPGHETRVLGEELILQRVP
jgi:hypothetical protein